MLSLKTDGWKRGKGCLPYPVIHASLSDGDMLALSIWCLPAELGPDTGLGTVRAIAAARGVRVVAHMVAWQGEPVINEPVRKARRGRVLA